MSKDYLSGRSFPPEVQDIQLDMISVVQVLLYLFLHLIYKENTVVPAHGRAVVKTDLSIAIPENTYARIAPRSGLAVKHFIDVGAGVVDFDYRGNIGVVLFNHSDSEFVVGHGDRIAQLIIERIAMVDIEEVEELPLTDRGESGFGSTGINEQESKRFRTDK